MRAMPPNLLLGGSLVPRYSSWFKVGACYLVLTQFMMSMYPAYCIRYFNTALLASSMGMLVLPSVFTLPIWHMSSIRCISSFGSELGTRGHCLHRICGFPIQHLHFDCIFGEATELKYRDPITNTQPHVSQHLIVTHKTVLICYQDHSKSVTRWDTTLP